MTRLLSFVVAMLLAHIALAQSIVGDFQTPDPRWMHPNFTIGIAYSGGPSITIDRNGNGIVGAASGDPTDPVYTLPANAQNGFNYFLSPTREFLYVTRGGASGCGSGILNMQVYRLPFPVAAPELVHSDCLPCGAPFNGTPSFYDTGLVSHPPFAWGVSSRRLMFIVSRDSQTTCAIPTARLALRVYDLDVPGAAGRATIILQEGWESFTVAQSGTACFIKHDLQSNPLDADYTLVDLCPGASFGQTLDLRDNVAGDVRASVAAASSSNLTYNVTDDGVVTFTTTLPDCLATGAPPTGACCVDGICTQVIQSLCTGTWTGNASCSANPCGPPPLPILSVSCTGPATVQALAPFSYTFTASNTGTLAASNIVVNANPPTGATFVSSSGGDPGSSGTSWNITSLTPGQSRTLTATYTANCNASSLTLSTYSIQSPATGTINGAPQVQTSVVSLPADPIQVAITSTPSIVPLFSADTVEYAITLTNPGATNHTNISMTFISSGSAALYHQQLSAGTGTFTVFNASSMSWVGNLAPFASTTIRFSTRIRDCLFSSDDQHQLNNGSAITVRNSCSVTLGSAPVPPPIPVRRALEVSLGATNVTSGTIGTPSLAGSIFEDRTYQPIRRGAVAEVALTVTNTSPVAFPTLAGIVTIPAAFAVADPPFVGTPPAGVTYDAPNRRINFAIPLNSGQSVQFTFAVSLNPGTTCENIISADGGISPNCQNLSHELVMMAVEPTPNRDHILGMDPSRGLYTVAESPFASALVACPPREIWWGLAKETDGDVWYAGLPLLKLNPQTLDFTIYDIYPRTSAIFNGFPRDVAWDDSTSTLLLLNRGSSGGGAIFRYNPATDVITHIITDPAFGASQDLEVDPDGAAIIITPQGLRRIPLAGQTFPLSPGAGTTTPFPNPGLTFGGALGTLQSAAALRFSESAPFTYVMTVISTFREDLGAPGGQPYIISTVGSLYSMNPDGSATLLIPQLTAFRTRVPSGIPTIPPSLTPLFFTNANNAPIIATTPGKYVLSNPNSPYFIAEATVSPLAGRWISSPSSLGPALQDLAWSSATIFCPADWNHDTGVDGDDVIAFFADWDANNADVNHDGGTDGDDVIEFFAHWDANC